DVVLGVVPQLLQGRFRGTLEGGEPSLHDLLHVGLLEQDEGVSEFEEDEVRVPTEPVALANVLRDHNLALAGHLHDVHTGVKRVLLLRLCPNGAKAREPNGTIRYSATGRSNETEWICVSRPSGFSGTVTRPWGNV